MSIHVTPIPTLIEFATPSITIGATAAAGDALTAIRSNSTIAGVALITSVDNEIARFSGTAGQLQGYTSGGPVISDTGIMTASAQPTVAVYADSQDNVTGDSTTYTVLWANEVWDIGGNFASNTFTAPADGKYLVDCQVEVDGLGAANTLGLWLVASLRTWKLYTDPAQTANGVFQNNKVIDMDTSDTLTVQLIVAGTGSDSCDILGGSTMRSSMTIYKVG